MENLILRACVNVGQYTSPQGILFNLTQNVEILNTCVRLSPNTVQYFFVCYESIVRFIHQKFIFCFSHCTLRLQGILVWLESMARLCDITPQLS